jgi:FixJ family two-component response regulator
MSRVFVIDDSNSVRSTLKAMPESVGHDVRVCPFLFQTEEFGK